MFKKILTFISLHKIVSGIIIVLLIGGGYFGYKTIKGKGETTRYVTAAAEKGTIIVSVSGSGQVSASDQVDIKSKASGEIIYVGAKNGQTVSAGALLVQLDPSDAKQAVQDAEINLQQEQLNLDKMKGMSTDEGALRGTKEKAIDALDKAYEDGFNSVADAFLDLPGIITGLYDLINSNGFSSNQSNIGFYNDAVKGYDANSQYADDVKSKYQIARTAYDQNFEDYKSTSRDSDKKTIESLINETYETTGSFVDAVRSFNNLIQFYQDKITERGLKPQTLSTTHLTTLNGYAGKINTCLSSLLSARNTIRSDKEAVISSDFDIKDQEIKVAQAEKSLSDVKEKLADYSIYSPFYGVVASIDLKKGDSISSGAALASVITKQKIAEISLNEIDAAKVKIGQKATLTFDAVEGLSITGEVLEIDTLGTVSQGVVTYKVKIGFDTQDERVKSGMSVSVAIITEAKQDVILVSNSAIKSNNSTQYVEVLVDNNLQSQFVETGLSNDTMTEIISGLKEGDKVVTQTITVGTAKTQTQQNSSFRIPGMTGGMR